MFIADLLRLDYSEGAGHLRRPPCGLRVAVGGTSPPRRRRLPLRGAAAA
eukprot:gene48638-52850_t